MPFDFGTGRCSKSSTKASWHVNEVTAQQGVTPAHIVAAVFIPPNIKKRNRGF